MIFILLIIGQNLPITWTQSYCTYDEASVLNGGEYSIGFGIDNYCIYSGTNDTIAYDERRFDIWARAPIMRNLEFELKYSYPTAGVISTKCHLLDKFIKTAFKFGFGYMKGTRVNYVTDYVYDFYGTLFLEKEIFPALKFLYAPKIIYSMHYRDRREHSTRSPRYISQLGHCIGLCLGKKLTFMPEINWLWGNNEGTEYMVNQFGLGVTLKIK
ncbi:MAG: hypothetical protein ACUVQ3_10085 [bacterium]